MHELAHVRDRDIGQTYPAIAIWRALVVAALLPMTWLLIFIRELGLAAADAVRVAVLPLIVYLLRNAIVRSRQFDADASLPASEVAAAIDAVITSAAVLRELAAAMAADTDMLRYRAPPAAGRLVAEHRQGRVAGGIVRSPDRRAHGWALVERPDQRGGFDRGEHHVEAGDCRPGPAGFLGLDLACLGGSRRPPGCFGQGVQARGSTRGTGRVAGESRESARDPGRVVVEVGFGIVVYPLEEAGVPWRCSPRTGGGGTGRAMTEAETRCRSGH